MGLSFRGAQYRGRPEFHKHSKIDFTVRTHDWQLINWIIEIVLLHSLLIVYSRFTFLLLKCRLFNGWTWTVAKKKKITWVRL